MVESARRRDNGLQPAPVMTMRPTHILAVVLGLACAAAPAMAVPPDASIACGALFTAQARQLATAPSGLILPYHWLLTARSTDRVTVDLLVYQPAAILRYTGFACLIAPNGALTPSTAAPPGAPAK